METIIILLISLIINIIIFIFTFNKRNKEIGFDDGAIHTKDGYTLCSFCKSKTILITKDSYWKVDAYPYKDQENTEDDISDEIETSIEISGHYCLKCNKMITLNINR